MPSRKKKARGSGPAPWDAADEWDVGAGWPDSADEAPAAAAPAVGGQTLGGYLMDDLKERGF